MAPGAARATPIYPDLAIKAGIEGKVVVRLLVGKDGTVRQAVVEHSTAEILNDAALDAARLFRFTPAIMSNGPVTLWVLFPFTFRLR
jgi:protein TonB